MPVETKEKDVKIRANRLKSEFRQQFGVTDEMLALGDKSPRVSVGKIQVPQYSDLDQMIAGVKDGDTEQGKLYVFKLAKTQLGTTMSNDHRNKFEIAPVSTSVKDADAMVWAAKNDRETLAAKIAAPEEELRAYIASIKEKIVAERQAAGGGAGAESNGDEDDDDADDNA